MKDEETEDSRMAIKIYIDQGHNPESPNAGAEGNGYREQDITYEIGAVLYELFTANPAYEARLSRPNPETILGNSNAESLRLRVADANAWGADIFLSLHANASTDPTVSGCESLVYARQTPAYTLASDISESLSRATGLRNRGVSIRPGLYVLRKTAMPAVLVEMGFISNASDAALMTQRPELFARGIYGGTLEYFSNFAN